MAKVSAGLLAYRTEAGRLEVLLVHPGGPYWAQKDLGAWTIPKGEIEQSEEPLQAARREFAEETGFESQGRFIELGVVKNKSGKTIHAFAFEGNFQTHRVVSITCQIEWPPRSGRLQPFPEIDRAEYFSVDVAKQKINAAQAAFIDELVAQLERHDK